MKLIIKIFVLLVVAQFFASCGADKLKNKTVTSQYGIGANGECSYTTAGPPVCGNDDKDYFNSAHAQCFTTVKSIGHCQCSSTLMVCGSDGLDHTECEAVASTSYTIDKFIPCNATEY